MKKETMSLIDPFYCPIRRRKMTVENCLDNYVNTAAYENKRNVCYNCRPGRNLRERFASSANSSFNIFSYLPREEP
jgi:hypothetical protein